MGAGRNWRSLADTAVAARLLYDARSDWESSRRGVDFYEEGLLIWLEADTIVRKQTQGRKSLDDFCKVFHGAPSGPPQVKPYTLESITEAMNGIAAYDWKGFFDSLSMLFNNESLRTSLGSNARIYAEENFDINLISKKFITIFYLINTI